MRLRRALLYMPGDSRRKIARGAVSGVDSVVMDLEDGVAPNARETARATTVACLRELDFGRSEALVRVNQMDHPEHEADLLSVLPVAPAGIVLPKTESVQQLRALNERLLLYELQAGIARQSTIILVIVETARGLARLGEIAAYAGAERRIQALIFGALDYIASVGGQTTASGQESFYARSAVVMQAKAHGLQAVDTVYPVYQDEVGLLEDTRRGVELGYTGKQIIHPSQIAPVQAAHSPTAEQIERARRIAAAYKAQAEAGVGAFTLDGQMVDMPVVKEAWALLERAAAAEA